MFNTVPKQIWAMLNFRSLSQSAWFFSNSPQLVWIHIVFMSYLFFCSFCYLLHVGSDTWNNYLHQVYTKLSCFHYHKLWPISCCCTFVNTVHAWLICHVTLPAVCLHYYLFVCLFVCIFIHVCVHLHFVEVIKSIVISFCVCRVLLFESLLTSD